jgi:tetratricopeptide (TPR) repeat protein
MKIPGWLSAVLFAFILLPFGAILFVSFALWQDASQWRDAAARGIAATTSMTDSAAAATLLKQELDIYEKHASSLQQMISILLGLSSLYAAVLGIGAYMGTRKVLEEGEKYVTDLEKLKTGSQSRLDTMVTDSQGRLDGMVDKAYRRLSEIEREAVGRLQHIDSRADEQAARFIRNIRNEYPMFGYMDSAIGRIMTDLMRVLPDIDPAARHYQNLSENERQQILFYEKTVASFGFFDLRGVDRQASQIYRGLGNFYGSKFSDDQKSSAIIDSNDLSRAKFYLDQAIQTWTDNVGAWNDRALLALGLDNDPALARQLLESSLKRDGNQQRARYDLAVLYGRTKSEDGYRKAINLLTEALGLENWETAPNAARKLDLYYNRACYRSLLAAENSNERDQLLACALDDLKIAMSGYDAEREAAFVGDLKGTGDLAILANTQPYAAEIATWPGRTV